MMRTNHRILEQSSTADTKLLGRCKAGKSVDVSTLRTGDQLFVAYHPNSSETESENESNNPKPPPKKPRSAKTESQLLWYWGVIMKISQRHSGNQWQIYHDDELPWANLDRDRDWYVIPTDHPLHDSTFNLNSTSGARRRRSNSNLKRGSSTTAKHRRTNHKHRRRSIQPKVAQSSISEDDTKATSSTAVARHTQRHRQTSVKTNSLSSLRSATNNANHKNAPKKKKAPHICVGSTGLVDIGPLSYSCTVLEGPKTFAAVKLKGKHSEIPKSYSCWVRKMDIRKFIPDRPLLQQRVEYELYGTRRRYHVVQISPSGNPFPTSPKHVASSTSNSNSSSDSDSTQSSSISIIVAPPKECSIGASHQPSPSSADRKSASPNNEKKAQSQILPTNKNENHISEKDKLSFILCQFDVTGKIRPSWIHIDNFKTKHVSVEESSADTTLSSSHSPPVIVGTTAVTLSKSTTPITATVAPTLPPANKRRQPRKKLATINLTNNSASNGGPTKPKVIDIIDDPPSPTTKVVPIAAPSITTNKSDSSKKATPIANANSKGHKTVTAAKAKKNNIIAANPNKRVATITPNRTVQQQPRTYANKNVTTTTVTQPPPSTIASKKATKKAENVNSLLSKKKNGVMTPTTLRSRAKPSPPQPSPTDDSKRESIEPKSSSVRPIKRNLKRKSPEPNSKEASKSPLRPSSQSSPTMPPPPKKIKLNNGTAASVKVVPPVTIPVPIIKPIAQPLTVPPTPTTPTITAVCLNENAISTAFPDKQRKMSHDSADSLFTGSDNSSVEHRGSVTIVPTDVPMPPAYVVTDPPAQQSSIFDTSSVMSDTTNNTVVTAPITAMVLPSHSNKLLLPSIGSTPSTPHNNAATSPSQPLSASQPPHLTPMGVPSHLSSDRSMEVEYEAVSATTLISRNGVALTAPNFAASGTVLPHLLTSNNSTHPNSNSNPTNTPTPPTHTTPPQLTPHPQHSDATLGSVTSTAATTTVAATPTVAAPASAVVRTPPSATTSSQLQSTLPRLDDSSPVPNIPTPSPGVIASSTPASATASRVAGRSHAGAPARLPAYNNGFDLKAPLWSLPIDASISTLDRTGFDRLISQIYQFKHTTTVQCDTLANLLKRVKRDRFG